MPLYLCTDLKTKKGDIVLFHSVTGQLIAHRLSDTKKLDGNRVFILKGIQT
jgi:hypothetical protein